MAISADATLLQMHPSIEVLQINRTSNVQFGGSVAAGFSLEGQSDTKAHGRANMPTNQAAAAVAAKSSTASPASALALVTEAVSAMGSTDAGKPPATSCDPSISGSADSDALTTTTAAPATTSSMESSGTSAGTSIVSELDGGPATTTWQATSIMADATTVSTSIDVQATTNSPKTSSTTYNLADVSTTMISSTSDDIASVSATAGPLMTSSMERKTTLHPTTNVGVSTGHPRTRSEGSSSTSASNHASSTSISPPATTGTATSSSTDADTGNDAARDSGTTTSPLPMDTSSSSKFRAPPTTTSQVGRWASADDESSSNPTAVPDTTTSVESSTSTRTQAMPQADDGARSGRSQDSSTSSGTEIVTNEFLCGFCNSIWYREAQGATCGERIEWLRSQYGLSDTAAKVQVCVKEFPDICGACCRHVDHDDNVDNICTPQGHDPYSKGYHVHCCSGYTQCLGHWDRSGQGDLKPTWKRRWRVPGDVARIAGRRQRERHEACD